MLRLLKNAPVARALSIFGPKQALRTTEFPVSIVQKQIIAAPTSASSSAPTTYLQYSLLEQYRNALVIPPAVAKELQNIPSAIDFPTGESTEMVLDSVLRKRRLKMKKHKLRKRRKAQRSLRRKLKKD